MSTWRNYTVIAKPAPKPGESWWIGASREGFTELAHTKTWMYGCSGGPSIAAVGSDPMVRSEASIDERRREWKAERAMKVAS